VPWSHSQQVGRIWAATGDHARGGGSRGPSVAAADEVSKKIPLEAALVSDRLVGTAGRRIIGQLPSNERVLAYVASPELASLDEYLEIYDAPVEIELEGEKSWPVPPIVPQRGE
jgi:hypothetical protein